MATKSKESTDIQIIKAERGQVTFGVLGDTPMILNRMSQKVLHELLLPRGRKTAAEKASTAKHDPMAEFRASPYTLEDPDAPTFIAQLAACFKKAIAGAALDIPGANKSQIGRLCWVKGERIPIYGIPQIFMSVTRSADMNRTPDIRTRCIIPKWACLITVEYTVPLLNQQVISDLLATAGMSQGIGDWRPQKGAGTYGQFQLVGADDPQLNYLMNHCGREAQIAAMAAPEPYDDETEEMLAWYEVEIKRRGFEPAGKVVDKAMKKAASRHAEH